MNALIVNQNQSIAKIDLEQALANFLRLNVADGDASPKTVAGYLTEVRQYSQWCETEGINPRDRG